jgi:hypothetical protein
VSDATLRIKNLSVALKALSSSAVSIDNYKRIARIKTILDKEIAEEQERKTRSQQWPPTKSALDIDPYNSEPKV